MTADRHAGGAGPRLIVKDGAKRPTWLRDDVNDLIPNRTLAAVAAVPVIAGLLYVSRPEGWTKDGTTDFGDGVASCRPELCTFMHLCWLGVFGNVVVEFVPSGLRANQRTLLQPCFTESCKIGFSGHRVAPNAQRLVSTEVRPASRA